MPSLLLLDIIALSLSTVLVAALMLTVFGAGARRELNRYFVLFTLVETAWAVSSLLLRFSVWLDMGPALFWSEFITLCLALMGPSLLVFTVRYVGRPTKWADRAAMVGLVILVALSFPLFGHQMFSHPRLHPNGTTLVDVNMLGIVASSVPIVYFVWSLVLFWQERHKTKEPYLALSVLVMLLGFVLGGVVEVNVPVTSITQSVSIALLGFGVVSRQLFNPLRDLTAQLEQRVEVRTLELSETAAQLEAANETLAQRTRYLEATASVAREAVALDDPQVLLTQVVNLISERFGFYHTGVFLLDPSGEWAELHAASSLGGQQMLARGHRLGVDSQSMVGYVTRRGQARIASDVGEEPVFFDNPDLPETHSAVTLPLRVRGEIIGALDVQSEEPAAFSTEDADVLQVLADQIAVAISNARLLRQAQESAEAAQRAYGELSREAWQKLLRSQQDLGFLSTERVTQPAGDFWRPEMKQALNTKQTTSGTEDPSTLAIPIDVRGQVVGVVDGRKADGTSWTEEEIDLLTAMVEQLNVALEGAQLYRETQRRAAREGTIREISDQMQRASDLQSLMRIAAEELNRVFGSARTHVRFNVAEEGAPVGEGDV